MSGFAIVDFSDSEVATVALSQWVFAVGASLLALVTLQVLHVISQWLGLR